MNNIQDRLKSIKDLCNKYIDNMRDGERVTFANLTENIALEIGIPRSNVSNILRMILDDDERVKISSGRNGGIFKSHKPQKVDTRKRCDMCGQTIKEHNSPKII